MFRTTSAKSFGLDQNLALLILQTLLAVPAKLNTNLY